MCQRSKIISSHLQDTSTALLGSCVQKQCLMWLFGDHVIVFITHWPGSVCNHGLGDVMYSISSNCWTYYTYYIVTLMKWISVLQLVLLYLNLNIKPIGSLLAAIQRIGTHWPSQWQIPPPPSTHPKEIDTELQNDRWMRQTNDCKDRQTHYSSS